MGQHGLKVQHSKMRKEVGSGAVWHPQVKKFLLLLGLILIPLYAHGDRSLSRSPITIRYVFSGIVRSVCSSLTPSAYIKEIVLDSCFSGWNHSTGVGRSTSDEISMYAPVRGGSPGLWMTATGAGTSQPTPLSACTAPPARAYASPSSS